MNKPYTTFKEMLIIFSAIPVGMILVFIISYFAAPDISEPRKPNLVERAVVALERIADEEERQTELLRSK